MAMNEDRYRGLLDDLRAEGEELTAALFDMADEQWSWDTPAVGWNIHDQVAHLAFFDEMAKAALTDPDEFLVLAEAAQSVGEDWIDQINVDRRAVPPADLLECFGRARAFLLGVFADTDPTKRTPWFGPSMSAASSASARLMETWAHSQDIHDALGIMRLPSERVRHVCHLGVSTRAFAYRINRMTPPETELRVELVSPAGKLWSWGTEDAADRVTGDGWDFALVVTQRRDLASTNLEATPGAAAQWLGIAQAFAGKPTSRP